MKNVLLFFIPLLWNLQKAPEAPAEFADVHVMVQNIDLPQGNIKVCATAEASRFFSRHGNTAKVLKSKNKEI